MATSGNDVGKRNKESPRSNIDKICRSEAENGLAFLVHFLLLLYYIGVHTYDTYLYNTCETPTRYFVGWELVGGQLRYLTNVTLWLVLFHYIMAIICDVFHPSPTKAALQEAADIFYTTVIIPLSSMICVTFWIIYAIDREEIFPSHLDEYFPALINHCWHTFPIFISLLESILVYHMYPSNTTALGIMGLCSASYVAWILYLFSATGKWVYSFLKHFSASQFVMFVAGCYMLLCVFYFTSRAISGLVWRERYQVLKELKKA